MTLDELYKIYGQQMVQKEILEGQILQTKQALQQALNVPNPPTIPIVEAETPKEGE